jgi:hypothetical protein
MVSDMPQYAQLGQLGYARCDRTCPAGASGPAPLPRGGAALLIAAMSGGLWLGICKLLWALF